MSAATVPHESNSGTRSILFAAGSRGLALSVPECAALAHIENAIVEKPPLLEPTQRAVVVGALAAPVNGVPLKELAQGKRRAAILVGDLSRPAPYDIALPALLAVLVEAEIRPSRIAFMTCPGGCGPLLGRSAIHRYGEEICGDHEVVAWPAEGTPGALYDSADLRIAVAPHLDGIDFHAFLPPNVAVDFSLELTLGRGIQIEIESARAFGGATQPTVPQRFSAAPASVDVSIVSGGGAPWENTLEEALFSLHAPRVIARTAVLVFSGEEGLGASRFSRDVWGLIEQAEEVLAAGKSLGAPATTMISSAFDPANTLAECLKRYSNTILFSQGFAEHVDGDDLIARLEAAPHVAGRLNVCGSQTTLWNALALAHGGHYSLHAEPLGWRG